MEQQESPLESIHEMKLFVDMEKQKWTHQIPLVGSYIFQKCCNARNHPLEPTWDTLCPFLITITNKVLISGVDSQGNVFCSVTCVWFISEIGGKIVLVMWILF